MKYYRIKLKHRPNHWEKYSIMDSDSNLEKFNWFLSKIESKQTLTVIIESDDPALVFFALQHGEEYCLEKITAEQYVNCKQHNSFAAKFCDGSGTAECYDGYYNGYYDGDSIY